MAANPRVQAPVVANEDVFTPPRRNVFVPDGQTVNAPSLPAPSTYYQLANALSQINPEINSFMGNYAEKNNKIDYQAGKTAAISTGLSYADAVSSGKISPDQSPYFMRAWKELDGANTADAAAAQIQTNYATDPIRNSTDPSAIQAWVQQQTAGAMSKISDPDMQTGAAGKFAQLQQDILLKQAAQASANATYGMTTAAGTQIGNLVDQYKAQLASSGGTFDPRALADILQGPNGMMKFSGMTPAQADGVYVESVINKAKTYNDPNLLQTLTQDRPDFKDPTKRVPGPGNSVVSAGQITAAQQEIANHSIMLQNHAHELEVQARTKDLQDTKGNVMDLMAHGQPVPTTMMDHLIHLDGSTASEVQSFQLNRIKLDQEAHPERILQITNSVMLPDASGKSRAQRLMEGVNSGQYGGISAQQLTPLYEKAVEWDNSGIEKIGPVASVLSGLTKAGDPNSGLPALFQDNDAANAVKYQFLVGARQIITQNPGVDPDTLMPQMMTLRDNVVNAYAKAFPGKILLDKDKTAHAAAPLPGINGVPAAAPAAPKAPVPTATGDVPSQFSPVPADVEKELLKHLADPVYVQKFKSTYGQREFDRIKKGIQ